MNAINIKDCPVKPDAVLKRIANKFGFELGLPQHDFSKNRQRTRIKINFGCLEFDVEASLETGIYEETECYVMGYRGVVLNQNKEIDQVSYLARIINSSGGCCLCPSRIPRRQVIQDESAPDWFPFG